MEIKREKKTKIKNRGRDVDITKEKNMEKSRERDV